MLQVDLKALLQLSKTTEGTLQIHKRIRIHAKGKESYIVCYELQNGILTIQRMRRVKVGCTTRSIRQRTSIRRLRQGKVNCKTLNLEKSPKITIKISVGSQTQSLERCHAMVDTLDLSLKICQLQQTIIKTHVARSSQTMQRKLEERSTQMELKMKTKCTQINPKKCQISVVSTQTEGRLQCRNSCAQTTMDKEEEEDEKELLSPHMMLLIKQSCNQEQLMWKLVQHIRQLIELKQLDMQKQQLTEIIKTEEVATRLRQIKAKVKPLYAKRASLRCKHLCCMQRNKTMNIPTQSYRQTQNQTPTVCKWTQTKVVNNLVAATQTDKDRDKGFLWLRRSNNI